MTYTVNILVEIGHRSDIYRRKEYKAQLCF
jgi:hypothetical protein